MMHQGVVGIAIVLAAVLDVGLAAGGSFGAQGKMNGLSPQEFGYIIRAVLQSRKCAPTPQLVQPMWAESCNKREVKVPFLIPFQLICDMGLIARKQECMPSINLRTSSNARRPHDFASLIRKTVAGFTGNDQIE
jgi:hypothetical protein